MTAPLGEAELRTALAPVTSDAWPIDLLLALVAAWQAGVTTVAIGAKLGVTKNAAVGKAHRLIEHGILENRPTPIRPLPDGVDRRSRAAEYQAAYRRRERDEKHRAEDEALAAFRRTHGELAPVPAGTPKRLRPPPPPAPLPSSVPRLAPIALSRPAKPLPVSEKTATPADPAPKYGRVVDCCWPLGEPSTKSFRFCDAPSSPGRPYCADHARLAYVKVQHPVTALLAR